MASVVDDPGGRRRILFVAPDETRKTIRLGKIDRKSAESIGRHVEALLGAKIGGQPIPRDTAAWLAGIGAKLRDRLAAVGLVEEHTAAPTLEKWCKDYIARRTDLAPRSVARLEYAAKLLVEYFGEDRRVGTVTAADAEAYPRWLSAKKKMGANTCRRQTGWAKQFFGGAVKQEIILRNPFAGLAANVRADRTRDHFVKREDVARIIDACPDVQWRLIVVLCRYVGLRCPSEVLALKWSDILWDSNRMTVPNEKTGSATGEAFRTVPLFPEVRSLMEDAFGLAQEGDIHVITRYRGGNANLRTQLARIARRAGVAMWEKPFVNMRASCATELAQTYPSYVVTKWLGHTEAVAEAHYWQVTEDHFRKAAQNPAQQPPANSRTEQKPAETPNAKAKKPQQVAASCEIVPICPVHPTGVEPVTLGSEDRCSIQLSYGCGYPAV